MRAAAPAGKLVHGSAVCLLPPRQAWPQFQELRCFHDRAFVRWPPHINLLYPWLEDSTDSDGREVFAEAALRCAEAVAGVAPFEVKLERLRFFEHGPGSCTLWADPVAPGVRGVPSGQAHSLGGP